jgi:hypothetical protein
MAGAVQAGGSVEHSAQALESALQASAHATVAGLKLVSGAAAIPLITAGQIGKVSAEIGDELWNEANRADTGPFPLSDDIVTATARPVQPAPPAPPAPDQRIR